MIDPAEQSWDVGQYTKFADQRMRPGLDLIGHLPATDPETVVDLGCGNGSLTRILHQRWPQALVIGIDGSADMLEVARPTDPGITWLETEIGRWQPDNLVDVIYSNAALHWVSDHACLFARLLQSVKPGGCLAVQMPDNWDQPSHTIPEQMLDSGSWPDSARSAFLRHPVGSASDYRRWLQEASSVDLWRTTYYQTLVGDNPVLEWVKGSVLAPVMAAMNLQMRKLFEARLAEAYAAAYPPEPDKATLFAFSRLFIVAVR